MSLFVLVVQNLPADMALDLRHFLALLLVVVRPLHLARQLTGELDTDHQVTVKRAGGLGLNLEIGYLVEPRSRGARRDQVVLGELGLIFSDGGNQVKFLSSWAMSVTRVTPEKSDGRWKRFRPPTSLRTGHRGR
jgi:hypothetical protein